MNKKSMIEIKSLQEHHKEREVYYKPFETSDPDHGTISSWNDKYIFVKYNNELTAKATNPEDLYFSETKL